MTQRTRPSLEHRSGNGGKRLKAGKMSIVKIKCKYCGHRKAFSKNKGLFCTRCRREH